MGSRDGLPGPQRPVWEASGHQVGLDAPPALALCLGAIHGGFPFSQSLRRGIRIGP